MADDIDAAADAFAEAFAAEVPPPSPASPPPGMNIPVLDMADIAAATATAQSGRPAAPPSPVNQLPGTPAEEAAAAIAAASGKAGGEGEAPAEGGHAEHGDDASGPLLAGLVAWHNKRWFRRRLKAEQIDGVGLVRFAYASGPQGPAQPLFTPEQLVPGLKAKRLEAFVNAHGFDERPGPGTWPTRDISHALPDQAVHWRYLMTAAYPGEGKNPLRALVGRVPPGGVMPVGGRPAWSLPKVGGLVAGVALVLGAAFFGWHTWQARTAAAAATAAAEAASAASAAAAASAVAAAEAKAAALKQAEAASAAAAAAAEAASAAAASGGAASAAESEHDKPADAADKTPAATKASAHDDAHAAGKAKAAAEPQERIDPVIKPDKAAMAAQAESADGEAERPVRPQSRYAKRPLHALPGTPAPAAKAEAEEPRTAARTAPAAAATKSAAPAGKFALVTGAYADPAPLVAMRRRLRQALGREGEYLQLELLPAPGGQALTLWPLKSEQEAQVLARLLQQNGIPMRVVAF